MSKALYEQKLTELMKFEAPLGRTCRRGGGKRSQAARLFKGTKNKANKGRPKQ